MNTVIAIFNGIEVNARPVVSMTGQSKYAGQAKFNATGLYWVIDGKEYGFCAQIEWRRFIKILNNPIAFKYEVSQYLNAAKEEIEIKTA